MFARKVIRHITLTTSRYHILIKLLPLIILLLALASGVFADGIPGGSICPAC